MISSCKRPADTHHGSNSPHSGLSLILDRTWASPARHLCHYFFHFWPLVQTLERGLTVASPWSSSTPPSLGRGRVVPPPTPRVKIAEFLRALTTWKVSRSTTTTNHHDRAFSVHIVRYTMIQLRLRAKSRPIDANKCGQTKTKRWHCVSENTSVKIWTF